MVSETAYARNTMAKPANQNGLETGESQIGASLKRARELAGLTQPEAASALNIHAMTLSKYERGEIKKVPNAVIRAASALYRRSADELLSGKLRDLSESAHRHGGESGMVREVSLTKYLSLPVERVLSAPRVLAWLYRFRAQLLELGATENQAERYADVLKQIVTSTSVGGSHQTWTEDDAIAAMQPEADEITRTFEKLQQP